MNYSKLVGHSLRSAGSFVSREGAGETTYNEKLEKLSNVLQFKIKGVTKLLLAADLADQVNFYSPYVNQFRTMIGDACGDAFVEATYSILPSVNFVKFTKTLKSHFIGLRGSDRELCLELIAKYTKRFPEMTGVFSDVLTLRDSEDMKKYH